ncbi:MAG: glycosyltransferase, partial [Chloroflexota bacterium]
MSDSQLRIAMLSAHSCPVGALGAKDTGGMSVYIREVAREIGKQGHLVDVYTRVHDPRDPISEDLSQNTRLIHLKAGEYRQIEKLAVYSHLPDFVRHLESYREENQLHYDVIYSHYWLSALAGKALQERWQVPHVAMFHTLGALKNNLGIGEKEPALRIKTEREAMKKCHRIIVATAQEKEALVQQYQASHRKISVVPCGVNMELFQPRDKEMAKEELGFSGEKIVLFVGRIEPLKGIDQLLKAMAHLQDSRGLRLVVIGGDESSQREIIRLKRLSEMLGIGDSVTFVGLIKQDKLPYFYSAADVCVVPSYYESFGLVALESLACGTPVVATNVGDLAHIISQGETGYVVKSNAPRYLADKIARVLLHNPDMLPPELIRASVKRFDWSNVA